MRPDLIPPVTSRRHYAGARPHRALCGASIAWANFVSRPASVTCPECKRRLWS